MSDQVSIEVCNERHKALENYLDNDKKKLNAHDCEIRDVKEAIVVLTAIQARHDNTIEDHEVRIRDIESKPAKRMDYIVTQIISVLIAGVLGGIIGNYFV